MRIQLKADSATPTEVYSLTSAYQRTQGTDDLPTLMRTEPTVTAAGNNTMGWESPLITRRRAADVLREFDRLESGLFDTGTGTPTVLDAVSSGGLGQWEADGSAYVEGERHRTFYTSENDDDTWTVYYEEYVDADLNEPIDGSTVSVGTFPTEEDADSEADFRRMQLRADQSKA